MRCTVGTSSEMSENSTATKNPLPTMSSRLTPRSNHSTNTGRHRPARPRLDNVPQANSEAPFRSPERGELFCDPCVEHVRSEERRVGIVVAVPMGNTHTQKVAYLGSS